MRTVLSFVLLCGLTTVPCSAQSSALGSPDSSTPSNMEDEEVRLSEILILTPRPYNPTQLMEAERKAEEVRDSIQRGTPFAEAAKANSQGPTAAVGGDLGCFSRGKLAKSLEDIAFGMKVGEVSDVIRTKQGYIILEVTDRGDTLRYELELLNPQFTTKIQPYLDQIRATVRAHWYEIVPLQARYEMKQGDVTVRFSILRDGQISDERVITGSGNVELDTAGLRAIKQASPFPPFPNTIKMDDLEMVFHFQYNRR